MKSKGGFKSISRKDLVQFNWYRYSITGFTETQKLKYCRSVSYYSQLNVATPRWADMDKVWDIFLVARLFRESGLDYQTDHIVPVKHPYVCGLHCPDNLRNIPAAENQRKNNNWWPDMWCEQLRLI